MLDFLDFQVSILNIKHTVLANHVSQLRAHMVVEYEMSRDGEIQEISPTKLAKIANLRASKLLLNW